MNNVIKKINDFLGMTTGLLINLIVAGTIIGILYDDIFGVIAGIGNAAVSYTHLTLPTKA